MYRRRRILVFGGLLALAAVIVLVFVVRPGAAGQGDPSDPRTVTVPEDLASVEEHSGESPASGEEPPECGAGQLEVLPSTDRESYARGEEPLLSLRVTNLGETACAADLGTAGLTFEVSSGEDEVWRSVDCQRGADRRLVILEPGSPLDTETITWDRTRSSPDTCGISREPVAADGATYHLRVAAAGVPGTGTAPFLLY